MRPPSRAATPTHAAGAESLTPSAPRTTADTTLDLCDVTACPVAPGGVDVVTKQPFPAFLPPMDLEAEVKGKDTGGADLFCVDLSFKVVHPQAR